MGLTQVSTDGVKNDAITKTKIPANQIEASELADNAVDTNAIQANAITNAKIGNTEITGNKLADQAVSLDKLPHGTSSNDGKFLRANNGADPSFETVSIPAGTTINNNADNRVITGSGTANTLNGESKLTYNGNQLLKISTDASSYGTLNLSGNSGGLLQFEDNGSLLWEVYTNSSELSIYDRTVNAYNTKFKSGGNVEIENGNLKFASSHGIDFSATSDGAGTDSSELLSDYEEGTFTPSYEQTWTNISNSNVRHANYTKVGNLVYIYMEYWMTGNNGAWNNNSIIRGFPYATANSTYVPITSGVMYGPSSYNMDIYQSGTIYFSGSDDRVYFTRAASGIRHIWLQFVYQTDE